MAWAQIRRQPELAHSFSRDWRVLDSHNRPILKYHLGLAFESDDHADRLTLIPNFSAYQKD
jgi:hypothetical protein